jgi:hypothetical protein
MVLRFIIRFRGLLGRYSVSVFLPDIHKLAVIITRLKNGSIRQFFFYATFAHNVNFFFVWFCKNLHELFFALRTVIWTVYHLFGVLDQDFDAVMWGSIRFVYWAHVRDLSRLLKLASGKYTLLHSIAVFNV